MLRASCVLRLSLRVFEVFLFGTAILCISFGYKAVNESHFIIVSVYQIILLSPRALILILKTSINSWLGFFVNRKRAVCVHLPGIAMLKQNKRLSSKAALF